MNRYYINEPSFIRALFYLIVFQINFTFCFGQSNAYHPFPENSASWGYLEWGSSSQCLNNVCDTELVVQTGMDTILLGIQYHLLFKDNVFLGGIREDSALRKIFYFPANDTTEHLLYDFSVAIGDTIRTWQFDCGSLDITVLSIDSTNQYSSDFRKIINLSAPALSWVEGMGSVGGILAPGCNGIDYSWEIICFKVDSSLILNGFHPAVDCNILSNVDRLENNRSTFYPNIIRSGESIRLENVLFDGDYKINIIDRFGIGKMQYIINTGQDIVKIDDMESGIYFLYGISKSQIIRMGKLVVVN